MRPGDPDFRPVKVPFFAWDALNAMRPACATDAETRDAIARVETLLHDTQLLIAFMEGGAPEGRQDVETAARALALCREQVARCRVMLTLWRLGLPADAA